VPYPRTLYAFLVSTSFLAAAAAATPPHPEGPSATVALSAFRRICLGGDTAPAAVLARAEAAGWTTGKPSGIGTWDPARDRAKKVGVSLLLVDAWSLDTGAGREDSCTVGATAPTHGWREAAQRWLGLSPSVAFGQTAVYYAVQTDAGWRAATEADQSNVTTSEGKRYNFVVADGLWHGDDHPSAMLTVDHFRPGTPAK
jgi:hypothetical protein